VLLCAEDDDLDLVALVHLGRLRGLDFEVRPGVEIDDAPLLGALDETPQALLVLVRSQHLPAARVQELDRTFRRARSDEQDLVAIRFERRRVGECLEAISKRLEQLGCVGDAELTTPDASTGRLTRLGLPINVEADFDLDIDFDGPSGVVPHESAEFEVTVRASLSGLAGAEPTEAERVHRHTDLHPVATASPPRRRMPLLLGVGAGGLVVAGGLWLGLSGSSAEVDHTVAPAAVPVQVEVEVIEAVEPDPEPPADEAWPPVEESPTIAPTPMSDAVVLTPDAEIVLEATPAKRRKHKRRRR
jgi:hypothetical protein